MSTKDSGVRSAEMYDVGGEDGESEGGATMFDDERQKDIRRRTKRPGRANISKLLFERRYGPGRGPTGEKSCAASSDRLFEAAPTCGHQQSAC